MADQEKPTPNIMGDVVNNKGIVTQGQVGDNIIHQDAQRPFGDAEKTFVLQHVSKQRKIIINVIPDAKAINLADRIFAYLRGARYPVDPVNHFLMAAGANGPPRGVNIENSPDTSIPTTIWVGY